MVTACHSCATTTQIAQYAAALDRARAENDVAALEAAEKTRKQLVEKCKVCKRATYHDDIRIKHSAHNHDDLTPQAIRHTPNGQIANLTEDDEDALRALIYTTTALDPLQFVVALHVARRGTARTVAEAVADFTQAVRNYKGKHPKATIKAKLSAIARKLKTIDTFKQKRGRGAGKAQPK